MNTHAHLPRTSPPRVTVLVSGWTQYGRGIIEGVWQYAQRNGPWMLSLDLGEPDERTRLPRASLGDGVIAAVHTAKMVDKLKAAGVPAVNVASTVLNGADFPRVQSDPDAVVQMAIDHLMESGLNQIAYCGEPHRGFIKHWSDAYESAMRSMGQQAEVYAPRRRLSYKTPIDTHLREIRHWVEKLPKPVGVIGWSTVGCRHLAMACTEAGLSVPDEVAIISLETEDLLGRAISPPISGVDIAVEEIGVKAAGILDQLFRGEAVEEPTVMLQPLGVTARQSTDLLMADDPMVRDALRFIRDHASFGIDVRDVLQEVPVARRTLERRFKELLNRTPAEEIRRVKLERVRELLAETQMSIPEIADAAGFNYAEHMIPAFKKMFDCTPTAYRKRVRVGG